MNYEGPIYKGFHTNGQIQQQKGIYMDETKTQKKHAPLSELPDGIKALIEVPNEQSAQPILLPAATPNAPKPVQQHQDRPKTPKEAELDELIAKRQAVIDALKAKNPLVQAARNKIAEIIPTIRGKGSSQAMRLMEEAEKIEFSISTEADTPKKEKDMIKRLREIKKELSQHKELEAAQKKVDAARSELRTVMSDIHSLERELTEARKACEAKYSEILVERKSAYEGRVKKRSDRAHRQDEDNHRRYDEQQSRVRQDRKREYDDEIGKYMKKHDDTVSLEEIVFIEKKEKKEKTEE